jgi:hypothetical protein
MTPSSSGNKPVPTAWHYTQGQWNEVPDLIIQNWEDGEDDSVVMQRLGYEKIHAVGNPDIAPSIGVWERNTSPRFAFSMETEHIHYLYTDTVPDLWDLLARWSPVVRDEKITRFLDELTDLDKGRHGTVETIARRAAWGTQQSYDDPTKRHRPRR